MSNEIKPWNPDDAINQIKDRIRSEFAALIPDEQWKAMVSSAIKEFLQDTTDQYGRGKQAGVKEVVNAVLREEIKKQLADFLNSAEWRDEWKDGEYGPGKAVKEIIEANATNIIKSIMGNAMQSFVNGLNIRR